MEPPIDLRAVGDRIEELLGQPRVVPRRAAPGSRSRRSSASSPSCTAAAWRASSSSRPTSSTSASGWPTTTSSRRCSSCTASTRSTSTTGCDVPSTRCVPTSARTAATSRCSASTATTVSSRSGCWAAATAARRRRSRSSWPCRRPSRRPPRRSPASTSRGSPTTRRAPGSAAIPVTLGRKPSHAAPAMAPIYGLRALAPGRVGPARDRGQQADRVPGRRRSSTPTAARARSAPTPSTRPRSTARCCAAVCAARPTTCRAPGGASTGTPRTSTRCRSSRTAARSASR